jgi:hypothetical protein
MYTNQLCKEFEEIAPEQGYEVSKLQPYDIPLTDDFKACEFIVSKWKWETDFKEGQRNNHTYNLAAMCCNYGIPEEFCFQYIFNNAVHGDFTERECEHTVNSAYKRVQFGEKVFRDFEKENDKKQNRQKRRKQRKRNRFI